MIFSDFFIPGLVLRAMKCPEWKFVGGEGIQFVAYDGKEEMLFLKFWNNPNPYRYLKVKEEMFWELMAQEHKTTFLISDEASVQGL